MVTEKSRTLEVTQWRLERFAAWLGKDTMVTAITAPALLDYLAALKGQDLAEATVRGHWANVRGFVRWLWRWDYLDKDPTAKIRPPKVHRQPKGFLPPDGLARLLDQAKLDGGELGARRAAMVWVLATAGLRRRELAGLEWRDLDYSGARIAVRQAKGGVFRYAVFHQDAQRAMLRYQRYRKDGHPCVWLSAHGTPLCVPAEFRGRGD